ncbi:hypothetical protein P170DRAFT_27978 [Aspergillus steynii IBT 23096]|uniref:Uncharacterized protein n=1 Tax=Aspergillus steynii IBT 23096 TaxID=1392250 RepID=A0A2I2GPZ1_9EURO|nr:uncharacterized protein P170DRAFT_27978 [Aspergillus steynii IBT 23096]PLB54945.1 hypothetical protein P170DRAFT_27978 [Aspergillus steynii IBT 23096]
MPRGSFHWHSSLWRFLFSSSSSSYLTVGGRYPGILLYLVPCVPRTVQKIPVARKSTYAVVPPLRSTRPKFETASGKGYPPMQIPDSYLPPGPNSVTTSSPRRVQPHATFHGGDGMEGRKRQRLTTIDSDDIIAVECRRERGGDETEEGKADESTGNNRRSGGSDGQPVVLLYCACVG